MGTIDRYKYLFVVSDKMKNGKMKRVITGHTLFDSQPDGPVYVCMCVYMYRYVCLYCNLFDVVVPSYLSPWI